MCPAHEMPTNWRTHSGSTPSKVGLRMRGPLRRRLNALCHRDYVDLDIVLLAGSTVRYTFLWTKDSHWEEGITVCPSTELVDEFTHKIKRSRVEQTGSLWGFLHAAAGRLKKEAYPTSQP